MTQSVTSPAFRYHGSKWRMYPVISRHFTPHTTYVEPFGGSASILLQKPPTGLDVLNDLDGDVYNFFNILRTRRDELLQAIADTPYSRAEFDRADSLFRQEEQSADGKLEQARLFFVLTEQGWGGKKHNVRRSWRRQKDAHTSVNRARHWADAPQRLKAISYRLRSVFIECRPALDIIREYDSPDTLFYVDPPYQFSVRLRPDHGYVHEMVDSDHRELLQLLQEVKGTVIISGKQSPLYEEMLDDWYREEHSIRSLNSQKKLSEVIWCNRQIQFQQSFL